VIHVRALDLSASIELRSRGAALGGVRVERAHIFEAADRPELLEAMLSEAVPGAAGLDRLRPGDALRALVRRRPEEDPALLFDGAIERVRRFRGPGDSGAAIVARARYHALRADLPAGKHWHATCGEIAEEIARALGLIAVVEKNGPPLGVVTRSGDPLRFLRGLARDGGFELAVSAGKLYLGTEFPETGKPYRADPSAFVEEIEDLEPAGGGVLARLSVRGDPGLRPLAPVSANGGRFTALRVLHRIEAGEWSSEAHLVRPGLGAGPARATRREARGGS
jgi:hypothetical protein